MSPEVSVSPALSPGEGVVSARWPQGRRGRRHPVCRLGRAGVVIATGHNRDPELPSYPGWLDGEAIHSRRYKPSDVLMVIKSVLLVGAGNSGCWLAGRASRSAAPHHIGEDSGFADGDVGGGGEQGECVFHGQGLQIS
jgi:cation diffusion facilitator CzcD-associated flavoprotein CzcO